MSHQTPTPRTTHTGAILTAAYEAALQAELAILEALQAHAAGAEPGMPDPLDTPIRNATTAAANIHHRLRDLTNHLQPTQP